MKKDKTKCIQTFLIACVILIACGIIQNISQEENVAVNATPITNKVVILDAGHRPARRRNRWILWNARTIVKPSNSFKIASLDRTKWSHCNTYQG